MGISGGPNIIEDGLVLALDASDKNSYPDSGTTWRNMSENEVSGTNSNMTYSSLNGGHFIFNNVSSVSTISNYPALNPTTELTIESWVNFDANSDDFIFEKGNVNTQYSLFSHSTDIVFRTYHSGDVTYHTQNPAKSTVGVVNGQWHHIVGSWDGSTKRIYIDGILKDSVSKSGNLITQTTGAAIGRFGGTSTGYFFGGKIAKVSVYNKGLSASEVLQNYNAQKSRFNL